jgi:predicted transcriptional regulator of viral defense system
LHERYYLCNIQAKIGDALYFKVTELVTFMPNAMRTLYQLAEAQAGYFTTSQAAQVGVSRRVLSHRAQQGDLEQVRYGLYRLHDFPTQPFEDVAAACLWVGMDSAASHETALAVHGISDAMPASIHVTVPRAFRGSQLGVTVHHAPLPDDQREVRGGVPVTTIDRTLHDVAVSSDPSLVQQAVEQAITRGVLSRRQLRALVRKSPEIAPLVIDALADE